MWYQLADKILSNNVSSNGCSQPYLKESLITKIFPKKVKLMLLYFKYWLRQTIAGVPIQFSLLIVQYEMYGSMSESEQLCTYPSPHPMMVNW